MGSKTRDTDRKRDETAFVVADIWGVKPDYIRKIRNGERENDEILCTITDYLEGKTKLIEEIKSRIPVEYKIKGRRYVPQNDNNKGDSGGHISK